MIKKLVMIGSALLLIGSFIFFMDLHSMELTNSSNPVSAKKVSKIMKTLKESEDMGFSCLLCNGDRVPFDSGSRTFLITLDMETPEWENLALSSGQSEYGLLLSEDFKSYDKQQVISEGKKFPLLIFNETQYELFYITFTGLPIIDLATMEGIGSETLTGSVMFYDTDFSTVGAVSSEFEGHVRGNTSRLYPKKGYKLNLKKKTLSGTTEKNDLSLFGLRSDDDWILYAIYNDESKMRDKLSIDLWNAYGAEGVFPESVYNTNLVYTEVVVDNQYYGLYGLMEPVDKKQLNLHASDYLYKRRDPGGIDYEKFSTATDPHAQVQGFVIKSGDLTSDAWKPMAELASVLALPKEQAVEALPAIVDVDNTVKMWLFLQLITGYDNRAKNMYYVAKKTKDSCKFYFAPWDMDLTWGNVSVGEANPLFTDFETEILNDRIYWETGDLLIDYDIEGSVAKMQGYYEELRSGFLSDESLTERIRGYSHLLKDSGAFARDEKRWPSGAHSGSYSRLLDYALERMKNLDVLLYDLEHYDE